MTNGARGRREKAIYISEILIKIKSRNDMVYFLSSIILMVIPSMYIIGGITRDSDRNKFPKIANLDSSKNRAVKKAGKPNFKVSKIKVTALKK